MTRARILVALILVLAIAAIAAWIYTRGASAGADAVRVEAGREQQARAAETRADERKVATTTAAIAARVVRADALTDQLVELTITEMRDAIDAVPPAAAGDPLPAAPVDSLRDALNAGIARANRAAELADAAGGADDGGAAAAADGAPDG